MADDTPTRPINIGDIHIHVHPEAVGPTDAKEAIVAFLDGIDPAKLEQAALMGADMGMSAVPASLDVLRRLASDL